MPNIETPRNFADTIWAAIDENWGDAEACYKAMTALIAARDTAIRAESAALLKMCGEALEAVESLIKGSEGVYGLHLNGSPAPWNELRTGAYFEEWLLPFDKALDALRETGVVE